MAFGGGPLNSQHVGSHKPEKPRLDHIFVPWLVRKAPVLDGDGWWLVLKGMVIGWFQVVVGFFFFAGWNFGSVLFFLGGLC